MYYAWELSNAQWRAVKRLPTSDLGSLAARIMLLGNVELRDVADALGVDRTQLEASMNDALANGKVGQLKRVEHSVYNMQEEIGQLRREVDKLRSQLERARSKDDPKPTNNNAKGWETRRRKKALALQGAMS